MKPTKFIQSAAIFLAGIMTCHGAAKEGNYLTNEPITIPLHLYTNGYGPRLAIYVGVNGGRPLPYLFDTGSSVLEAIINNKPYKTTPALPGVKNIYPNFGYAYGDGNGFSGTLVQTKVSLYRELTDSNPLITFTNAASSTKGIIVNAVSQHWLGTSKDYVTLDTNFWKVIQTNNPTSTTGWPIEGHIVGTFGAAPFIGTGAYVLPIYPPKTNGKISSKKLPKTITYGSVIGQVTTNGYIVDATSSNPTLTIGYSAADYNQFSNNILASANPSTNLEVFPGSLTPTIGYEGGNELNLDSEALSGSNNSFKTQESYDLWTPTNGVLLDTGTGNFNVKITNSFNSYAFSFVNEKGNIYSNNYFSGYLDGYQLFSFKTTDPKTSESYSVGTKTFTVGLGIFLQNSVLFDLANTQIGFIPATNIPIPPQYDHIVVVVLENHGYAELATNNLPFINGVIRAGGADMTKSYSLQHPSQPNYYWLFSGSNQGIFDDSIPPNKFNSANLYTELASIPTINSNFFRGYIDGYPGAANLNSGEYASLGNLGANTNKSDVITYAQRHCPWLGFNNVPTNATADFATFNATAYSNLPYLSIVIPALENDMHDYAANPNGNGGPESSWTNKSLPGVSTATNSLIAMQNSDAWLSNNLSAYARWAQSNNSLLIITTDEDSTADWPTPPNTNPNFPTNNSAYENFAGSPTITGLTAPTASFSPTGNGVNGTAQSGPNQITTLFYGAHVIHNQYPEGNGMTHVNLLRTIEWLSGITQGVGGQSGAVTNIVDEPVTDIFAP